MKLAVHMSLVLLSGILAALAVAWAIQMAQATQVLVDRSYLECVVVSNNDGSNTMICQSLSRP